MRPRVPAAVAVALLVSLSAFLPSIAEERAAGRAGPTCEGARATIVGTARSEVLVGTPGRDVVVALGGNDVVRGRGGDDLVCGGAGTDKLWGGPGDDRLLGGLDRILVSEEDGSLERVGDVLRGGRGADRLVGGRDTRAADEVFPDTVSWDDSATPVRIDLADGTATGQGRDRFEPRWTGVVASAHDDTVLGSARSDWIDAGRGHDTVRSGEGDDRVHADGDGEVPGRDLVVAGPGDDVVESGAGSDHLVGGPGDDELYDTGDGPDVIQGGDGADVVSDQLTTRAGTRLAGGAGLDRVILQTLFVESAVDPPTATMDMATGQVVLDTGTTTTFPAEGFERVDLTTFGFAWTITGTGRADEVSAGGSQGATFRGLGGDDRFSGTAGDDTFDGGAGTDRNLGMGVGTNTCVSVEVDDDQSCTSRS